MESSPSTQECGGWLLYVSLAAKCGGELHRVAGFVAVFLVAFAVTSLLHWASPGGPAWGRYWWNKRGGLGIGAAIPGPRGVPVVGSMLLMTGLAHRKLAAAVGGSPARRRLMALSLGETRVVVTADPDVAKELLASAAFADRPVKESAYGMLFHRAIGFAPYGTYWRALRRVASTHLFSPRQVSTGLHFEVDDRADDDGFNAKVVRSFTDAGGRTDADVSHRNLHSITKRANEVRDITEVGDGKLSASQVLYAARADANTAAAGKWHRVPTDLVSEHNSDGLVAAMMIMIMMTVGRAGERKRSGRATCFSAAVLTMLLVAVAFANSAAAARPLPASGIGGGHNEVAAAAPGMPRTEATAGHSSCTTDPNTQEPVRCIHH